MRAPQRRTSLTASTLALAILLAAQLPLAAQTRDSTVALTIELDHPDWRYRLGESARFTVRLLRAGEPVPGATVIVAIAPERMKPLRVDTAQAGSGQAMSLAATLTSPGFLRATATAVMNGVSYTQLATAAYEPERIRTSLTKPADFETFWSDAIAEARRVPLEPVLREMQEHSTDDVAVYHVSFQNHRAGSRLYGILSMPKAPGRYPAMLVVPGAGVRPYFSSIGTARRGVIHLAIGIHGIPVDRDSLLYNELRASALRDYQTAGIEDRDRYYYKRVYVGVVRAGDFIFSLPQFDGSNYVVQGGSQGGGLAIIAGALDPRVKGIASSYPAMADHLGYLEGRAGGWPHVFADTVGMKAKAEKIETLRYYDVVNFARLLRVPGIYAWGYNDLTVPPTSMYAAYNEIAAPKEVVVYPPAGHARTREQLERMDAWLLERLAVRGP